MNKNSKIYIAGHRGLVGSAIVRRLKSDGFDNLILKTHKELDLLDQVAAAAFFRKESPEYVILAAAKVGGIVANNTYRADFLYENLQIQNNVIHQSYLHRDDMADACIFVVKNIYFKDCFSSNDKQVRNTHLNIGTGKDLSIKELAELIFKVVGYRGKLYFNTDKPDGTMIKLTNPSKINSLGWEYSIELEDGLKQVYEWYKGSLRNS